MGRKRGIKDQPIMAPSDPYLASLFNLLVLNQKDKLKLDESKVLFFKQGHNPIYSENLLVYVGRNADQLQFVDIKKPTDFSHRSGLFSPLLMDLISKYFHYLKKVGWIIIYEHKWGFLLNLKHLQPIYDGNFPEHWVYLLQHSFFIEEFIKYAYFNYEVLEQNEINMLMSTEFDPRIRPSFCPLYKTLLYHQKQEVGWMFNLENQPSLTIPIHMESVPLLDTGYFINAKTKEISLEQKTSGISVPVPSGILASQIGSGKTVSMIGLMSIGSQFMNEKVKDSTDKNKVTKGKDIEEKEEKKDDIDTNKAPKVNQAVENKMDIWDDGVEEIKINPEEIQKEKAWKKNNISQSGDVEQANEAINGKLDEIEVNDDSDNLDELRAILKDRYEPSLIIVTKNILYQWRDEFKKFAPYLRVFVMEKVEDILELKIIRPKRKEAAIIEGYDIILTHRKVIEQGAEHFQSLCPLVFKVNFKRIVIDEIHELITMWNRQKANKGKKLQDNPIEEAIDMNKIYQCLSFLHRQFTWGMTGTPNNLNFYSQTESLFKVLRLQKQFTQLNVYKQFKTKFLKSHVRANPCSILLPPLVKRCVNVDFGQVQNFMYQAKLGHSIDPDDARIACSQLLPQYDIPEMEGSMPASIQNAIAIIYQKHQNEIDRVTLTLAQTKEKALEHRLKALQDENNFYLEMIQLLKQKTTPCTVCMCEVGINKLVVTNCVHSLCLECYTGLLKAFAHPMCPICRNYMNDDQLVMHPRYEHNKMNKLKMILDAIDEVPEDDKIIIFTQFHTLVEKLEGAFTYLGINYIVLKGQPSEISISLRKFEAIPEIKILLMSVEQAASGINITVANHVFFAHPIFGTSKEKAALTYQQCIGRAYRIGQEKSVNVKLFVTNKSLEESMTDSFLEPHKIIV